MTTKYTTKLTNVNGTYCCRVLYDGTPIVEARVDNRQDIGPAFRDMLRTLDKLARGDKFTKAARYRNFKPGVTTKHVKHIWFDTAARPVL